jgi:hypothetical protein
MAGCLRRGDPPPGDLVRGLLAQPGRDPAARRQGRQGLGERLARAFLADALAPELHPVQAHRIAGPAHVPRLGYHRLVHTAGGRAAIRAGRCGRAGRDHPHLDTAVRSGFHAGDLQALHAEQRRRRILEHDARGFLLILKAFGGPRLVGAAGSRTTAT